MAVPFYDASGNRLGVAAKNHVHENGLWHRSVLIAATRGNSGQILVHTRAANQSFAGREDLFGGHEDDGDAGSIQATAVREASEELIVFHDGVHISLDPGCFKMIGALNSMVVDTAHNREKSTLFGLRLPERAEIGLQDEGDDGQIVRRDHHFVSLQGLEARYRETRDFAADGLGRVLDRLRTDEEFRCELAAFLFAGAWTICFQCQPGCGCPDNAFYAEHIFFGTYEEAEIEARRINHDQYYGDFRWDIR